VPAPEPFGYRNKMEFSFHPDPGGRAILGLHERGTFDRVFEIHDCLLPSRLTIEIVRLTQAHADTHHWPAITPRLHDGQVRHLVVRHLPLTDQCAVHLVAAVKELASNSAARIAALSSAVRGVSLLLNRSRSNVASGESERVLVGDDLLVERLLDLEFEVRSGAFLQTNSRQAETLYRLALESAEIRPHETVLDLYCGSGTLTLLSARRARAAIGVESVEDALHSARRNATRNGLENTRFVAGEVRRVLREWARGERPEPARPEVVIVDPPRAGLHPRVVARTAELRPRRIVYVSESGHARPRPQGLRGARLWMSEVTPVDMFPHTPHIECVARLDPVPPGSPAVTPPANPA
jgi:23S rRNA (uracil1939-C5)-methyltransferase